MATQEALAIACDRACVRIEEAVSALTGEDIVSLPRVHRDREILRKQQLETIANWLEAITKGKKHNNSDTEHWEDFEGVDISELRETYELAFNRPSLKQWSREKIISEINSLYAMERIDAGGRD